MRSERIRKYIGVGVQVRCDSPEEFQNTVWEKASRWEARCRRLGTAAGDRRAACRVESCTATGSGTAERTGCCPCYDSHSLQRTYWWPLSWPVRAWKSKKRAKGKVWGNQKNKSPQIDGAFPKWHSCIRTHHDGFSLKCLYFLSQVFVCLKVDMEKSVNRFN